MTRTNLPGFICKEVKDTKTHEVEVGTIEDGGHTFVLHLIRNIQAGAKFNLNFLVAKVFDSTGQQLLWDFKAQGFNGAGIPVLAGDDIVVALVDKGRMGKVERVVPLSTLVSNKPADLRRLVRLKYLAAESIGRECVLTKTEEVICRVDQKRLAEQLRLKQEQEEAARVAAREERIKKMLARGRITAYTVSGEPRYGIPVLAGEWQSMTGGTYVIIVDSFDEVTGKAGVPLEAFQVVKERGKNPTKGFPVVVTSAPPARASGGTIAAVRPVSSAVIEKDGSAFEVMLYKSMDDIRAARAAGLNGGTLVAIDRPGRLEVYAVLRDRMDTIGLFEAIA